MNKFVLVIKNWLNLLGSLSFLPKAFLSGLFRSSWMGSRSSVVEPTTLTILDP